MILGLWEIILVFLISAIGSSLAILVYIKNPKESANRFFTLLVCSFLIWILTAFLSEIPKNLKYSLFLSRIAYTGALLSAVFLFYFSFYFPRKKVLKREINYLIIGTSLILTLANLGSGLIVKDAVPVSWGFNLVFGKLYFPYLIFCIFVVFYAFKNFLSDFKKVTKLERLQLGYLLLGLLIFTATSIIVNVIIRSITGSDIYYRIGNYSGIFLVGLSGIAILKYHLFEVRVILTELLVGLMGIILFLQIIFAQNLQWRISSFSTFLLFLIFAFYLVKSVHEEERRREEAEKLAQKEREIAEKYQVLTIRLMAVERSLREIAERERILRESAEKLSQAKTEFIALVSHQLRTPLTIISGYLSMILDEDYGEISQKLKEIIKKILQSTQRLIRLVNSILDVSKIEAGEMEVNFERVDLREIAREVVDELKMKAKEKNLYLELKEPKEKIENFVDKEKIKEVLFNLVDNAIKYTQEGGITLSLKRIVEKNVDQICVKDTGEGLTKEEREKIFERFSRGRAGLKFWTEGAGLGLFISKSFVEMHGGKIWVESEGKGKGSTFYIELPIKEK